jgi:hypothetical protein
VFEVADGKLLVAGTQNDGDLHGGCNYLVTVRVGADGSPDPSYGQDGVDRHRAGCALLAAATLGPGDELTTAGGVPEYSSDGDYEYLVRRPDGGEFTGMLHDPGGSLLSDADRLNDGNLLLSGTITSEQCAVGGNVDGAPCNAIGLKLVSPDGSSDDAFGDGGLVTYPPIHPALDRRRFRLLVALSMPETVRFHSDELRVRLRCPTEIRTGCRFALALKAGRGKAIELRPASLEAGASARFATEVPGLDLGDHGNLRGQVSAPGQDPVGVNSRVAIRR